eukprot:Pgem_evm1s14481
MAASLPVEQRRHEMLRFNNKTKPEKRTIKIPATSLASELLTSTEWFYVRGIVSDLNDLLSKDSGHKKDGQVVLDGKHWKELNCDIEKIVKESNDKLSSNDHGRISVAYSVKDQK